MDAICTQLAGSDNTHIARNMANLPGSTWNRQKTGATEQVMFSIFGFQQFPPNRLPRLSSSVSAKLQRNVNFMNYLRLCDHICTVMPSAKQHSLSPTNQRGITRLLSGEEVQVIAHIGDCDLDALPSGSIN